MRWVIRCSGYALGHAEGSGPLAGWPRPQALAKESSGLYPDPAQGGFPRLRLPDSGLRAHTTGPFSAPAMARPPPPPSRVILIRVLRTKPWPYVVTWGPCQCCPPGALLDGLVQSLGGSQVQTLGVAWDLTTDSTRCSKAGPLMDSIIPAARSRAQAFAALSGSSSQRRGRRVLA